MTERPTRVAAVVAALVVVAVLGLAVAGVEWAARPAKIVVLVAVIAALVRSRSARRAVRATARAFYDSVPKAR